MKNFIKSNLFLIAALFIISPVALHAQKAEKASLDSAYVARIQSAWDKIRETDSDSLQRAFADEFYQYYLSHPDTKVGEKAIFSAFLMWGNTGAAQKVDQAIKHISYNSKLWSRILNSIGNAYVSSDHKELEDYILLLQQLKGKLTHLKSKSAVVLELAELYKYKGLTGKSIKLFQQVVSLKADSFAVEKAKSKLFEINNMSIGDQAPNFKAKTLSGKNVSLKKLKGKVVLLEFWAVWCGPCRPEIPYLKKVYKKYKDKDFQIIGISLDENTEKLKQFIKKHNMDWLQIQQKKKWDGKIADLYRVYAIPSSYLINRQGMIVAKNMRKEDYMEEVSKLMN